MLLATSVTWTLILACIQNLLAQRAKTIITHSCFSATTSWHSMENNRFNCGTALDSQRIRPCVTRVGESLRSRSQRARLRASVTCCLHGCTLCSISGFLHRRCIQNSAGLFLLPRISIGHCSDYRTNTMSCLVSLLLRGYLLEHSIYSEERQLWHVNVVHQIVVHSSRTAQLRLCVCVYM